MTKYVWDDISDAEFEEAIQRVRRDELRTESVLARCRAKLDAGEKLDADDETSLRKIEDKSGRIFASLTKRDPEKATYRRVKALIESRPAGQMPPGFYTPKLHAEIARGLAKDAAEYQATIAAARVCLQYV